MKEQRDELDLEWDCGSTFPASKIKSVVLEHLQPSTNLKSFTGHQRLWWNQLSKLVG